MHANPLRRGSNPLGEDVVGLEGKMGKYCALMLGVNLVMFFIPEPKAKHGH